MSEQQGAPAPSVAVVPPAAPPIPPGLSTTPQPGDESQPWFKERLARAEEQARQAVLKELGIKDSAKAKEILTAAEKAAEEAKSTGEKLGETATRLKELEERESNHLATFKVIATERMASLTEAQRKAVIDAAGEDDFETQILIINAFAPTWAVAAPSATGSAGATGATGATASPTPPATGTAPPPNAPPPNGGVSPPDRKAEYAALKVKNPHAAQLYLNKHHAEIYPPS